MRLRTDSDKKFNCVLGKYEAIIGAFIFSVLIFCIAFASIGVYPFQSRSTLIIDWVHQYLGFYEEFCRQLGKSGNWMFSNWGMGHDFYSVFSYYLSSPFSLVILFLMKFMYVNEAVTIVVLLKIGCIASCITWYVQKKTGGRNDIALCTGCAYGLCNYVLGYYSNLMWLDCVMLLPILAWSIEKLVNGGCWKRYTIVLEYCIISNYYFGFMLCVFAVLYYLAVYIGSQDRRDSCHIFAFKYWKRRVEYGKKCRESFTGVRCCTYSIVFLGEIGTHAILSIQHTGSAHRSLYEASGRKSNGSAK